jgi:hypothetical protein
MTALAGVLFAMSSPMREDGAGDRKTGKRLPRNALKAPCATITCRLISLTE